MILRYLFYGLVFILAFFIGLVIFPIIYIFRKAIRAHAPNVFNYFLNSDEIDELSNDYGDAGWRKRKGIDIESKNWLGKFIVSYRWAAIRNPHYNLKLAIAPRKGKKTHVKIKFDTTSEGGLIFCNEKIRGRQFATYRTEGRKYFRFSFTLPFLFWTLNHQSGTSSVRYIYKLRLWSKKHLNKFV